MNFWDVVFINPILNLLIALYQLFTFLKIPGAFGFAIVALTAIIRLILHPLTSAQLKSAQKIQHLKPRLDEISKKHKEDKVKLQQAQMELYKEAGVNPAAGCLPLLVQIPIFIALYNVFNKVLNEGVTDVFIQSINQVVYFPFLHLNSLDLSFFGLSLTVKPNEWQKYGIWLLAIPVITGLLQFLQSKLMMSTPKPKPTEIEIKKEKSDTDQMAGVQKQMAMMMPVMIGFFALSFPIGLSLYWNTFSIFGIMQQLQINKTNKHG